jgi:putative YhbY family RNA-binding protein
VRAANSDTAIKKGRTTKVLSEITAEKKQYVKRMLAQGKPVVCIGKGGASSELLKEIERQLKKEEMVKVKILKSALAYDGAKQLASRIAEQTKAYLVEVRGHTFILYKSEKE